MGNFYSPLVFNQPKYTNEEILVQQLFYGEIFMEMRTELLEALAFTEYSALQINTINDLSIKLQRASEDYYCWLREEEEANNDQDTQCCR
ncbi:hypothetical protein [Culicoidibacter larvae]|uniref:Uncharacterized protein n=1 Tax=Culicoidibacter larvae TaxID=2579976 RepID=A0A5R8Q8I7_9FIRM|nr:hypothetical protein [Culicoidibacter larvae]TLG71402.1 hypothetical protein FEZ08_10940 [Culicoidibacter larvae]